MVAGHAANDPRPVVAVLGVVDRVDVVLDVRVGRGELDVALDAASTDPARAGGGGAAVPRVVRPVAWVEQNVGARGSDSES
jgi:hypothetical protein